MVETKIHHFDDHTLWSHPIRADNDGSIGRAVSIELPTELLERNLSVPKIDGGDGIRRDRDNQWILFRTEGEFGRWEINTDPQGSPGR